MTLMTVKKDIARQYDPKREVHNKEIEWACESTQAHQSDCSSSWRFKIKFIRS